MIHLACVHGVNTAPDFDYITPWAQALRIPDVATHLTSVRWPSQDNPVTDWLGLRLNPGYRERCLDDVREGLRSWAGFAVDGPRCVVAHSMGVPLAMRAIAELGIELPFIGIGSPMTHPILGPRLERVGFGEIPGECPKVFSNREDYICALKIPLLPKFLWRHPRYLRRVEVEINAPPHREHDAEKYLELREVSRAIKHAAFEAWGRD